MPFISSGKFQKEDNSQLGEYCLSCGFRRGQHQTYRNEPCLSGKHETSDPSSYLGRHISEEYARKPIIIIKKK